MTLGARAAVPVQVHAEQPESAELPEHVARVLLGQAVLVPVRHDVAQPLVAERPDELASVQLVAGQPAVDVEVVVHGDGPGRRFGGRLCSGRDLHIVIRYQPPIAMSMRRPNVTTSSTDQRGSGSDDGLTELVDAEKLRRFTQQVFERCGMPGADAEILTDHLIWAELRGLAWLGARKIRSTSRGCAPVSRRPPAATPTSSCSGAASWSSTPRTPSGRSSATG